MGNGTSTFLKSSLGGPCECTCWAPRTHSRDAPPYTTTSQPDSGRPPEQEPLYDSLSIDLPEVAEKGPEAVVQYLSGPGQPEDWILGLDLPMIKSRACALEQALDQCLNPVVARLETYLHEGLDTRWLREQNLDPAEFADIRWESAVLSDILKLLPIAALSTGHELATLATAITGILKLLHAICLAGAKMDLPVPAPLFEVSSVNRLLHLVNRTTSGCTPGMTQDAAVSQWGLLCDLAKMVGLWPHEQVAVTLAPSSKCLMVHYHAITTYGVRQLNVQVGKDAAFLDSMEHILQQQVMEDRVPCVLLPSFTHPDSPMTNFIPSCVSSAGMDPRADFFMAAGLGLVETFPGRRASALSRPPSLFTFNESAGKFWFNTALEEEPVLEVRYSYAGWLMGQLFANRASLGIPLPEVFFEKLLHGSHFRASLETLSEFDTEAAAAIRNVQHLPDDEYERLLEEEGYPVTMCRPAFQHRAVQDILKHKVAWQFACLSEGFYRAIDRDTLQRWRVTPADMMEIVEGNGCPALQHLTKYGKSGRGAPHVVKLEASSASPTVRDPTMSLRKLALTTSARLAALKDGKQPFTPPAKAEMPRQPHPLVSFLSGIAVRVSKTD